MHRRVNSWLIGGLTVCALAGSAALLRSSRQGAEVEPALTQTELAVIPARRVETRTNTRNIARVRPVVVASMTAPELYSAYDNDTVAADRQYSGQTLDVTGKVRYVEIGHRQNPFITLDAGIAVDGVKGSRSQSFIQDSFLLHGQVHSNHGRSTVLGSDCQTMVSLSLIHRILCDRPVFVRTA